MCYNFVRIHKLLRITPVIAAGVSKKLLEISGIVDVIETWENTIARINSGGL